MSEETDTEIMKKCLEDAGILEENMPSDMVKQFYKAIKDSESTADQENQNRQLDHSDEDLIKQLDESINEPLSSQTEEDIFVKNTFVDIKDSSSMGEVEDSLNGDSDPNESKDTFVAQNSIQDVCKFPLSYSDMCSDTSGNILPIVYHKLKYVAIQNSDSFQKADSKKRVEMMKVYFEEQAKILTKLAKNSKHKAPLPKPIIATHVDTDILASSSPQDDFEETYVSRSGRQTKRKVYNYDEDESSQEEASTKKSKNEDTNWFSKSTAKSNPKSYLRKKSDTSIASELFDKEKEKMNISNAENKENGKMEDNSSTKENITLPKRTPFNKKLSNTEIMQRSPLFSDAPNKKSRSEEILERARVKEQQKKKEERENEDFVQKLVVSSEEQTEDLTMDVVEGSEDVPMRRRIVPPIPGRRGLRKTKAVMNQLPITSSSTRKLTKETDVEANKQELKPSGSPKSNKITENGVKLDKSNQNETSKGNRVVCPLCSMSFQKSEIEAHASSCCDDDNVRIRRSTAKLSRITCELCDKVVPLDMEYEVHVNECVKKHRE